MMSFLAATAVSAFVAFAPPVLVSVTEGGDVHPVQMRVGSDAGPAIFAVNHASAVIVWEDVTVFIDPVGSQAQYAPYGRPDIVILTHPDPDHVSIDTMIGMLRRDTVVLAPRAVINELPLMISNNVITPFAPGSVQQVDGITFTAIPAYVTRTDAGGLHPRARGDVGVVMEAGGTRVYISGSTEATPEMRALVDIDAALVAINAADTMDVVEAANAVAAFAPKIVIPYQYRGQDGVSDLDAFAAQLNRLNPDVIVHRLDWY